MNTDSKTDTIEQEIRTAVEDDAVDVRETVRQITLKALSDGALDMAAMRRVMKAVVSGARSGAAQRPEHERQALGDAMKGLDEALAAAAQATQLAVQEAAGRTAEFSRHELGRALEDLKGLESQFLDTLSTAASGASDLAATTLRDLVTHARSSGTVVGRHVTTALGQLADTMATAAKDRADAGVGSLRQGGAALAGMAAGLLTGIAEHLQSPSGEKSRTTPSAQARDD